MTEIRVHRNHMAFYAMFLALEVLKQHLQAGRQQRRPLHLKMPTGAGKTRALIEYVRSGAWKQHYTSVIIFVNSHHQVQELYKLLQGCGSAVGAYPQRGAGLCGDLDQQMVIYERMRLPTIAFKRVCEEVCPKCGECPFAARLSARWAESFDIIIAPEQLLTLVPGIARRWAKHIHERVTGVKCGANDDDDDSDDFPPSLVILDEAKLLDKPFVRTFQKGDVEIELKAIEIAIRLNQQALGEARATPLEDQKKQAARMSKFQRFQRQLAHLDMYFRWLISGSTKVRPAFDYTSKDVELFVQEVGADKVEGYQSNLQLINRYRRSRAWNEGDAFAVRCTPVLPESFVTLGAYLDSRLVQHRLKCTYPIVVGDGELLRVPGTRIYNIRTTTMTVGNWEDNAEVNCSVFADVIVKQRQEAAGRSEEPGAGSVVLVSRKDSDEDGVPYMTKLGAGVTKALVRRGITDTAIVPSDDPSIGAKPDPRIIPVLHYGQTGVNSFEDYETAICCYTFQFPDFVVSEAAFGDRAPAERPLFRIVYDSSWNRTIECGPEVSDADREMLKMILFRLEVDPALQAVSRIRQNIKVRTIIMSILHPGLERQVGPVIDVPSSNPFRERFGLPTTKAAVKGPKFDRAVELHRQGVSLKVVARMVGVGYSTLKGDFAKAGIAVRRGRPVANGRSTVLVP